MASFCGNYLPVKVLTATLIKPPLFTVLVPIDFIYLFHLQFRRVSFCWCGCVGILNREIDRHSLPFCSICRSHQLILWLKNRNITPPNNINGRKKFVLVSKTLVIHQLRLLPALQVLPAGTIAAIKAHHQSILRTITSIKTTTTTAILAIVVATDNRNNDSTIPVRMSLPISCWGAWLKWSTSMTSVPSTRRSSNESTTCTPKWLPSKQSLKNKRETNQSN